MAVGAIGAYPDPTVTEGNTITVYGGSPVAPMPFLDFYVAVFKIN